MTSSNPLAHSLTPKPARTRLIFAGTPEFAAISLQALIAHQDDLNIDIVAVYTQPDRKAGRGQKVTASAVKQLAIKHHIPVEQPQTFKKDAINGQVSRETLASYHPDVMIVAAYGLILPLGVLNTPTYGCLNIHASLLPRWRGAAPIHRALLAGDEQTGVTIMQMDKGLDTGDMLYKVAYTIESDETTASLHDKLADMGANALMTVLTDLVYYQNRAQPQKDSLATYAEKLSKQEGEIDWTQPATVIERQIRGMYPYPGTFTFLAPTIDSAQQGKTIDATPKRVKILAALPVNPSQVTAAVPGTVISTGKNAILVACGKSHLTDGMIDNDANAATTLRLTKLQFAGSKPVTAEQICHGNQLIDGDCFVSASSSLT